jgi:signal peptidase I
MNTLRKIFDRQFFTMLWKEYRKPFFFMAQWLVVLLLISVFVGFSVVPSTSMVPTLQVNDELIFLKHTTYQRGDIVLFHYPLAPKEIYVKRLIGLPGDTVEIVNGQVLVNGKAYKVKTASSPDYYYAKTTVPPGDFFMMGDNRNNSNDSHVWGFLPQKNVIGRAVLILLPFNHFQFLQ